MFRGSPQASLLHMWGPSSGRQQSGVQGLEGPQTLWFLSCRGRVGASGCPEGWVDPAAGPGGPGSHGVEEK